MIGVDTNVLLRLFVNDNEPQHKAVRRFITERNPGDPAFVPLVVLVELEWALTKRYGYSQERLFELLDAIAASPDFLLEQIDVVVRAVEHCRSTSARLTDVLVALLAEVQGCTNTVTFDREAARQIPGMELLK